VPIESHPNERPAVFSQAFASAEEVFVSSGFIVEFDKQTVGVAVRVPGGFRFFHSDPRFLPIEGQVFRRARGLTQRVAELVRRRRRPKARDRLDEPLPTRG
jgi:hypothetical protein